MLLITIIKYNFLMKDKIQDKKKASFMLTFFRY
ncbi:hypothetical protein SC65A3_00435 [Psychrobacter sp. SC65A.3]|nr:hypothetical protein SC65A3_00435 [Psychrobacter sp. SC65A.3]